MPDQATDVVGLGLEAALVVLCPFQPAPGEAAPVVGHDGVMRREVLRSSLECAGLAVGPGDHHHERAAAAGLVVELRAGNLENAHATAPLLRLREASARRSSCFRQPYG